MIVQRFNLNLIPNQSPVVVHVNQYDTGTGRLIATLYEGNEPYSPNGTAVIQGTKPDGHGFQYSATLDGNVVTADLTEQMSPVAGDVRAQIVVTESSGETGTFVFIMRVQPSALPSDADMSESDYPLIEEAIREAQEAVIESHDNAENSEAWAQGTRSGVPVGPTDPTYEHNAEYWAHQAEGAASGVSSFNGRSGSILPIAGDYDSKKILLSSALHIGGETQSDVQEALEALSDDGVQSFNGRSGSVLPMAGDYNAEQITYNQTSNVGAVLGELEEAAAGVASKTDLASINATGTINTTGTPITKGTYFYLNGDYVRAKADIANGATFTIGTNVEATTVGDGLKGNTYSGTSLATLNALIAALTPSEYANSTLGIGGQLYFPRDDAGSNTYRRYQYILLMASNPGIQYYVRTYDHTTSTLSQGQKNTDGVISSTDITSTMTSWNLYVK